jgi:hypothetical protein
MKPKTKTAAAIVPTTMYQSHVEDTDLLRHIVRGPRVPGMQVSTTDRRSLV